MRQWGKQTPDWVGACPLASPGACPGQCTLERSVTRRHFRRRARRDLASDAGRVRRSTRISSRVDRPTATCDRLGLSDKPTPIMYSPHLHSRHTAGVASAQCRKILASRRRRRRRRRRRSLCECDNRSCIRDQIYESGNPVYDTKFS